MAAADTPLESLFDSRFDKEMTLAQRMHLVMTRIDYIQKDPKKPGMQYSYTSHDKVTGLIREHTVACGIHYAPVIENSVFQTDGNRAELKCAVRFTNIHDPGDFLDVLGIGYGIDPGDKGPGKAMSYAVKYALLKAFGLETGDDADADQDVQHRTSTAQRAGDLETRLLNCNSADELIAEITSPATKAIMEGLKDSADADTMNRLWRTMKTEAAKWSVDPHTGKKIPLDEPLPEDDTDEGP